MPSSTVAMSMKDPYTPISTDIPLLQQQQPRLLPVDSTISASTAGATTEHSNGNDYHDLNGQEGKHSLTKPFFNTIHPNHLSLPETCEFASTKDNDYFHALFKSVPKHDRLLEIYKCALHREILLQGHLYLSENYACFHANIFGWITNLVIEYTEVTLIERKMTAIVIPNGIQINTQHAKHIFASFIFREAAYQQLNSLWTIHQPKQTQQQPSQQSQSSSTLVDEQIMDSDESDSDDTESILNNTGDDSEEEKDHTTTFRQQNALNNCHHHCFDHSSTWKIVLIVLLLMNSLWMIRKWSQLDNRLQHQYHRHHHYQQRQQQTLFDPIGLSSAYPLFYYEKSSSQPYYYHHPIYTKLTQLRQQMESLDQKIIDRQLISTSYPLNPFSATE